MNSSKTDIQLKQDIEAELLWDPKVNAAQIGVSVDHGAVSLLGQVDTYVEKWAAEDATRRVSGVRAVAQDLTVKILIDHMHSDAEIAGAVLSALKWDVAVPATVTAKVTNGTVTLEGKVNWNFQRDAAERAVRNLAGVVAVNNVVTLKSHPSAAQIKEDVQAALHRQSATDTHAIRAATSGGTVTLTGQAASWQAIDHATDAAWAAPGVTEVIDHITRPMAN